MGTLGGRLPKGRKTIMNTEDNIWEEKTRVSFGSFKKKGGRPFTRLGLEKHGVEGGRKSPVNLRGSFGRKVHQWAVSGLPVGNSCKKFKKKNGFLGKLSLRKSGGGTDLH